MRGLSVVMLGAVLLIGVAEGGTLYRWAHYHARTIPEATPALLRDMPSDDKAIREEFSDRVAARFPEGMPEAALTAELAREGFEVSGDPGVNYVQKKGFCLQDCWVHWSIGWTRDAQGHATAIVAYYEQIGTPVSPLNQLFDTDPK